MLPGFLPCSRAVGVLLTLSRGRRETASGPTTAGSASPVGMGGSGLEEPPLSLPPVEFAHETLFL